MVDGELSFRSLAQRTTGQSDARREAAGPVFGGIMRVISISDLRLGDVLLYHGDSFISRLIELFDGGTYSHSSIFDGKQVMEALADGIEVRTPQDSVAGVPFVDVYRFVSKDGKHLGEPGLPTDPLSKAIIYFEDNRQRYAYEEIVLLAVLTTTRKIPLPPILAEIVRNLLDSAADVIATIVAAGRQPVICSELVFRCYQNAGNDYEILIRGADVPKVAVEVETVESSLAQAEVRAAAENFLVRYALAKGNTPKSALEVFSVQQTPFAVADFVTPHDLEASPSLQRVGRLSLPALADSIAA